VLMDRPFPRPAPRDEKPFPRPPPRDGKDALKGRDEKHFPRPQPRDENGGKFCGDSPAQRPQLREGESAQGSECATESRSSGPSSGKGKAPTKGRMAQVKVFVRWRPLVGQELKRGDAAVVHECVKDGRGTMSVSVTSDRMPRVKTWKGAGYSGVFRGPEGNAEVFDAAVEPMVSTIFRGKSACLFCYGHTGSGKTHTVLGYGPELGLYRLGADRIFEELEKGLQLSVRFAELHNGRAFDLLDGRAECQVREDADGAVHFRKDPTVFPDGRVRVRPLASIPCGSSEAVAAAVTLGSALRAVGSSSLHDQSSRSHAILEMEVVSEDLLAAREAVVHEESLLVPLGKELEELNFQASQGADVDLAEKEERQALLHEQKQLLDAARERLAEVTSGGPRGLGGTLVLVDLAGAEHGNDAGKGGRTQTPEEVREGKEINTSLLHLKEVVRAMASGSSHVPFRSCRLTRVMRHWLRPGCCCSMVSNVSGSDLQAGKSLNTLQYAALVASAGG